MYLIMSEKINKNPNYVCNLKPIKFAFTTEHTIVLIAEHNFEHNRLDLEQCSKA